jgi:hypothetical protein
MPPAAGLRAHVELSRISGYIVCETFKIAPRNYERGHSIVNINKALKMLDDWKLQLPSTLANPHDENSDPACCILHMAQNQLIVLTTRPILLAAVKQAVAKHYTGGQWSVEHHAQGSFIQACVDASHRNLILAQRLRSSRKLLQAGLHFVFNAAVILLLNQIFESSGSHKMPGPPPPRSYASEIQFAIWTFEEESRTGTNYPRDCCRVLQDLKALIDRYLSHGHGNPEQEQLHNSTQRSTEYQGIPLNTHESSDLHQKLQIWTQSDGLQLGSLPI